METIHKFSWIDYQVFGIMLGSCLCVGVYFGIVEHKKQKADDDHDHELHYFVGGRELPILPVSLSLIATAVSGIIMIGTSTEIYLFGTQFCYIVFALMLMALIVYHIYLPVFHDMNITSVYEYLQARFDTRMRVFCSVLFTATNTFVLPIMLYISALTYSQMTGVSVHVITPIACLICIFYTSVVSI
jgi:Na+/proline symporter